MYNMKQISIIIALALLTTIANAQNIKGSHQVRANDEVMKQQVEYAAVDSKLDGKSLSGDSINSYRIINESLRTIVDSLETDSKGEIKYALIFSNCDNCLSMVVVHVMNENDVLDMIEKNPDYYKLEGCLVDYQNYYILSHCLDEQQVKDLFCIINVKRQIKRKKIIHNPYIFDVYKENIAFLYKNNKFYQIRSDGSLIQ